METIKQNFLGLSLIVFDLGLILHNVFVLIQIH
jgi:hypothetical protein